MPPTKSLWLGVLLSAAIAGVFCAPLEAAAPIAHYPLITDGVDATGRHGPMNLQEATFQDGGVYCNGIYVNNPGGYLVQTPELTDLDFASFAISAEFKISEHPGPSVASRPIFMGGFSFRWIGAEMLSDGRIFLRYNNSDSSPADSVVSLDVWHTVVVTYDASIHTGALYLDEQFICSAEFDLVNGGDRDISTTNFGSGRAFKGILRELVVYDSAFVPTAVETRTWGAVKNLFR